LVHFGDFLANLCLFLIRFSKCPRVSGYLLAFMASIMHYCITWCHCVRFDDAGGRRPSSQPMDRSRDAVAGHLFDDVLFGADDNSDWLDMATGPVNKKSDQTTKNTVADRPLSEGNVANRSASSRQSNIFSSVYLPCALPLDHAGSSSPRPLF